MAKKMHSKPFPLTKINVDIEIPTSLFEKLKRKVDAKEIVSVAQAVTEYLTEYSALSGNGRYGVVLPRIEVDALIDLEKQTQKTFPCYGSPGINKYGIYQKQGHVTVLHTGDYSKPHGAKLLKKIPDSIGNLVHLERLALMENEIESVPDSISNLRNLRELILDNNLIQQLPESMISMENLEILYLYNNKLTQIPWIIGYMPKLKEINLVNNPFENESMQIYTDYLHSHDIEKFKTSCRLLHPEWHPSNILPEDFMEF